MIQKHELENALNEMGVSGEDYDDAMQAFADADTNENGTVEKHELEAALGEGSQLAQILQKQTVDEVLAWLDTNEDG